MTSKKRIQILEQEIKDKDEYMKVFESEFKRLIEKEKKYDAIVAENVGYAKHIFNLNKLINQN